MPYKNLKDRKEYGKKYYIKHKDHLIEVSSQWNADNPERASVTKRKWEEDNPDKAKEHRTKWCKANPDKLKAKDHRHRTAKTKAGGSFSATEWKALCKKYKHLCLCCGKKKKLTADHVIPVSKGGTSNISNIQPLCGPCNSRKRDKTIDYRKGTHAST